MGNQHFAFPMLMDQAPFNDINVRKALKYIINLQEMVDQILQGHGKVGNDHPIGPANQYFASEIPQLELDIDRAKFHMKLAEITELNIDLFASDVAFNGATDAANLYQATLKNAGININVVKGPTNDYWTNVWRKKVGAPLIALVAQQKIGCFLTPTSLGCPGTMVTGKTHVFKNFF